MTARDSFLIQKAKVQWSLEGDLNTAYFYNSIKRRVLQNKVMSIEDKDGRVCTEGTQIQKAFLDYYKELLGSQKSIILVNVKVVRKGNCCTLAHWEILDRAVTTEEVTKHLLSIPKDKSPGPDGYTSQFYRDAWEIVGNEVCADVFSLIVIMCARLAEVLPDIIRRNQGAFIQGNSILENILICQDLVRMYNRGTASPRWWPVSIHMISFGLMGSRLCSGCLDSTWETGRA
ncbi:uncharacterized protein LOC141617036 [Silene latifolia]|uniref:uncharacterized protein LOC141617036 n=1 Tax=Silene latifolia TaxID=37657 RepID=UPI003D7794C0